MPGTYKHPASARACMSCHFWGNLGGPDVPALSSILDLHSHNAASIDALPPKMAGKTWQKKSEKNMRAVVMINLYICLPMPARTELSIHRASP